MKIKLAIGLIVWIALWNTGCKQHVTVPETDGTTTPLIRTARPHSLDEGCDDALSISRLRIEVRDGFDEQLLLVSDDSYRDSSGSVTPLNVAVPTGVSVHLITDAFNGSTPLLRGELRRIFTSRDSTPIVLPLVPHPAWATSAATLVPGTQADSSGFVPVSLHYHLFDPLSVLWAVVCWNSTEFDVDTASFHLQITDGLWMPYVPPPDPALLDSFRLNETVDRAMGLLLVRADQSMIGFQGYAGYFRVRPLAHTDTATFQLAAAGPDSSVAMSACLRAFIDGSQTSVQLDSCVDSTFGGYAYLLNRLRAQAVACDFSWTVAPGPPAIP